MILVVVSFGILLNFTSRAMPHLPHLDPAQPVALESEWGRSDQLAGVQYPFQHCDTIYFPLWDILGDESPVLEGTSWPFAVAALSQLDTVVGSKVTYRISALRPDAQVWWRPVSSESGVLSLGVDVWELQQEGDLFSA